MGLRINRTITKKDLLYEANIVKEKFNGANFKSKSSGRAQKINKVEVVEKGMAVYFWCSNMNNFVVCAGTKKQTYGRLVDMFMYISLCENDDHIYLSEFIVR
jgi:hypothetical protein